MKIKKFEELNEAIGTISLLKFRLYDRTYGPEANKATLSVYLRPDNTLGYSYYGGWQGSGIGFAISNLQLKKSLPSSAKKFKNVKELQKEIESILATGVGSHWIKEVEELNELPSAQKEKTYGGLEGRNNIIAKIKYLSNIDHVGSADDMQDALEEIYDLLDKHFPDIEEEA
ncbi:MAG: hypothetical protein HPY57_13820 [Ignavibacteria bacterium]|nr:hypothetical protein [Ignavibacteria bacterium]